MALLSPKAGNFGDGHAFDSTAIQRVLDVFEFEVTDDGFDFFMGGVLG